MPLNQFILGGDSMFSNNLDDIDTQIQRMELYRQRLKQIKESQQIQNSQRLIWDEIDSEITPMSSEQKNRLLQDQDYTSIYTELQSMVQSELLNLVKANIEGSERGKDLLQKQLKIVRKLKTKIIEDTDREMEMFKRFKEYSKEHPNTSYDEFIKETM